MAVLSTRRQAEPPLLRIEPFKGINLSVTPTQIDRSQSPDMLNFSIDRRGALKKRTGFERVYPNSLGEGPINGVFRYTKTSGESFFLLAHGTKLYTQTDRDQPIEIYEGLAGHRVNFFIMNDKCYIMDGTNYLVFDGDEVKPVTAYIPTVSVSKEPAGGGTSYEDFNLLGAGFQDSFSADGTAREFVLTLKGLDATPVTAGVNGTPMNEGNGFIVDRVNGKVTFTSAPAKGTNNVVITAYKTQAGWADRIKKCTFHTIFGGSNDTRVFVSGNPDMPDYIWRLGLYDPTYAPENGFYKYPDKVMAFAKQYDSLVVFRSRGVHVISYELTNGEASFPSKPINDQIGTLASNSVQIIENNPVMLSRSGVYMLTASNVRDERNMQHISLNVDNRLLEEPNLEEAITIDHDQKYWLAVNGNVYIFDYMLGEWYFYNNIYASEFIERDGDFLFASSKEGLLYRFKHEEDVFPYNDDGEFINAYWLSAKINFSAAERNKLVQKLFATMNPMRHTSCNFYYVSDMVSFPKNKSNLPDYSTLNYAKSFYNDKIFNAKTEFIDSARNEWFDYETVDYSLFSYNTSEEPDVVAMKVKAKKVAYYQLVIQNTRMNEGLIIDSMALKFIYQNYRK